MTPLTSPAAGRATTVWRWWAVAVLPAMIILPFYVFPLDVGRPLSKYDGRRVMEILWAAGLLIALLRPSVRDASARWWSGLSLPSRAAVGAFVLWALLSAAASAAPAYAFREWGLLTVLLVAVAPLAVLLARRRARVLEALGLTAVLYAILVFPEPFEHGFTHPRFLGQVVAVAAPALLFSGTTTVALMAAPLVALGMLNGSRALGLTLALVTLVAPLLWRDDRRRRILPGLAALAVAGILLAILLWLGHGSALQDAVQRGTSSTGRILMWRDAFERFAGAPLLGLGPGMLAVDPGVIGLFAHPHNSVFLIAAETGIVGLACVGVLVARGLQRLRRLEDDRRPWVLALLGGGIHSLFSGTIIMPASQALLVLSLALALPDPPGPGSAGPRRRTGWMLAAAGAVAMAVLMATLFLPPADGTWSIAAPRFFGEGIIPDGG